MAFFARVTSRQVWRVSGSDTQVVMNNLATTDRPGFCHMLNAQGRVLFDAFVVPVDGELLVEVDASLAAQFRRHLGMYSLRKKVKVCEEERLRHVLHVSGPRTDAPGVWQQDTRLPESCWRLYSETDQVSGLPQRDARYETVRILSGCAEGAEELGFGKAISLECNLDRQDGVSFEKGCYLGQELVSRSHFSGVVRKRLTPIVAGDDAPPDELLYGETGGRSKHELQRGAIEYLDKSGSRQVAKGDTLLDEKGKECGQVVRWGSEFGQLALALLRLQYVGARDQKVFAKESGARIWPLNI
jgi:folate-binding protein YgfZ